MMLRLGRYARKTLSLKRLRTPSILFFGTLTPPNLNDTLRSRLMGTEEFRKVTPVLNEWLKQGNEINPKDLRKVINDLCKSNRFTHALQVAEWISKRETSNLTSEDFACRLYLVEIHSGLSKAVEFFNTIPNNMKDDSVYTTLLSLYTKSKKTRHVAEATYHKMREQRMLSKPYPYYNMISLYGLLGEKNMVDEIVRQMNENKVEHDNILTANNVLRAYANVPDVEAMEKFMMVIEGETPRFKLEWQTGISIAKAYLKAGLNKKAIEMLRRTEIVGDIKWNDSVKKVLLLEMYKEAGAIEDELRLSRFIYWKDKKGKGSKIYKSKGSGRGSSDHPLYFYGCGCGGLYGGGGGSDGDDCDDDSVDGNSGEGGEGVDDSGGGGSFNGGDFGGGGCDGGDIDGGSGCGGGECGGCGGWD